MVSSALHVLIVDDSPEDRLVLRRHLTRTDSSAYRVTEASRGDQALAACETTLPDCILLDYRLPDSDGLEVLATLRAASDVPVVMLTGVGNEALAVEALKHGAQDYLVKGDLTPERLSLTIQHAVETVRLARERDQMQALLATVLEALPVGVAVLDADLSIRHVNPALTAILGQTAAPSFPGWALPSLWPALAAPYTQLQRGERFRDLELCLHAADEADDRWLSVSGTPLGNTDAAESLALLTVQDITARRQAEADRRASEARFRAIIENGTEGVILLGAVLQPSYVSPTITSILGYTSETFAALWASGLCHPDDQPQLEAFITTLTAQPDAVAQVTTRLRHQDGSWRWIEQRSRNQIDTPALASIIVSVRDVTARVLAEQAAQAAAERLNILAAASHAFAEVVSDEPALLERVAYLTADPLRASCGIWLRSADSAWLQPLAIYDRDPAVQGLLNAIYRDVPLSLDASHPAATVARSGQPVRIPVIDPEAMRPALSPEQWAAFERVRPHSSIIVPLKGHGATLGSLAFTRHHPGQPAFTEDDLTLAQELADRAALALTNARLYQEAVAAQQAATEALARLDALIGSIPSGIGYLDRELHYQLVNPALAAMNGGTPEQHLGRTPHELIPGLAPRLEPMMRQVLATGEAVRDLELHGQTCPIDGKAHDWLISYFPVREPDGVVSGVGVSVTDITQSKQVSAALHQSEQMLRLFVTHAPAAIAMFDRSMRYLAASDRYLADYRLAKSSLIGRSHYEIFPELPERLRAIHQRCLAGASEQGADEPFPRADGTLDWVRWELHPWYEPTGEVGGLILFSEVITAHKQAEEALRASETRYRILFETMAQGVIYLDGDGQIIGANPAAEQILGLTLSQMQGRTSLDPRWRTIHEDGSVFAGEAHPVMQALRTGQEVSDVVMGVYHPGLEAYRWISIQAVPHVLPGAAGVTQVYALFSDITEQREAAQTLEHERRQLAAILHTMHEGVMAARPDGSLVLINPAALMMSNFDPTTHPPASLAELAQQGAQEFITPEGLILPSERWPIPRVLRGEHVVELELGLRSPQDGTTRWHHFNGTPVYDQDGTLIMGVVTGQDITQRKQDEAQLRQQASMLDHAHVLIRDAESRIVFWNHGAERLYNWTTKEAIGQVSHELLQTRFPSSPEDVQAELFATGRWEGELVHHRRDGSVLVVASLQILFRDPSGAPAHILEVNNDVTALKRAEETLREREAQLELAHEVAGLGTWRHDLVTGLITLDAQAQAHHGVEEATFPVAAILARFHPDDALQIERQMQASFDPSGTGRTQIECRVMLPDGGVRWIANHASVVFAGEGAARRPVFGYGTTQDITARKADEAALRAAHAQAQTHAARLDSLLTNAPVGISLLDAELRFQAINPYLAAINGFPPEAHLGRTISEVLPDIAPLVEPIYAQVLATGKPLVDIEIVGETPAEPGVSRIWTGTYFPVHTADHTLLGVGAIIIDITTQRQLERALQTEHRQLAAILENLDEGVMALQPDGTLVTLNGAVRRHLGWPADAAPPTLAAFREMFRHTFYDRDGRRLPPEEYPAEQALRGQSFQDVQLRLVQEHDGQERWFAFTGALVHDAEDALELVVVTARDITVEWQAALALRENQQNLQVLIDNTDGALWSVDRDFGVVVGNTAFRQLARALIGEEFGAGESVMKEKLPAALLTMMHEYGVRALAGEHLTGVVRVPMGGEERSFEYRVSPMRTAAGAIIGATTFARDITEQQWAEQALRDTERKLGTLFALLPVGVSIVDATGALAYTNPAMERIMRLDRASLATHAYTQRAAVRPDGTPLPASEFAGARALREQQPEIDVEAGFTTEAGERVWVSSSAVPVDFPDWRIVVVMSDITTRIQAELALRANAETLARTNAELTRALRLKDEFLAMMSHELRTPLNAVLGVTEALEEELYGPIVDRQRQALGRVNQSARHLLAILSDILDLTFIEAGKAVLDVQAVDVDRLCRTALQLVQASAQAKGLHLFRTVAAEVEGLRGDERRLTQILTNLLTNAVKFTPAGGQVGLEVSGDATQERIALTVWDTGIGIAPEGMGRLFQPFTQVDGRLSRAYEGIGLGLTLVRRLAEMHGGSVSLESTPGQGSRFIVSLPWSQGENIAPATPRGPVSIPSSWVTPPRLVIADDHEIILQFYAEFLGEQGCQVALARTGVEAVAQVRTTQPAVAIIDVQMPELDGLSAIQQIRADPEVGATPIIALTALAMPGDRERCLAAGANAYLAKPVGIRTLIAVIADLLAGSNPGHSSE